MYTIAKLFMACSQFHRFIMPTPSPVHTCQHQWPNCSNCEYTQFISFAKFDFTQALVTTWYGVVGETLRKSRGPGASPNYSSSRLTLQPRKGSLIMSNSNCTANSGGSQPKHVDSWCISLSCGTICPGRILVWPDAPRGSAAPWHFHVECWAGLPSRNRVWSNFDLTLVCGIRTRSRVMFLHVADQSSQHQLVRRLSLLRFTLLSPSSKINWSYILESVSG